MNIKGIIYTYNMNYINLLDYYYMYECKSHYINNKYIYIW